MFHLKELLLLSTVVFGLFALACTAPNKSGVYYASGKKAVTPDGLHQILWEPFAVSFVKPGARLGSYDSILIDEVTIRYKRPPQGAVAAQASNQPNYGLSQQALANMRKTFASAFEAALTKNQSYRISQEPGPKTLRIAGHIVDLTISAAPQNQQADDATLFVASSGAMTLILNVEDSQTGAPLVRVGERHQISLFGDQDEAYSVDEASTSAALRSLFQAWASELARELNQLRNLPEIPEDPESHDK